MRKDVSSTDKETQLCTCIYLLLDGISQLEQTVQSILHEGTSE